MAASGHALACTCSTRACHCLCTLGSLVCRFKDGNKSDACDASSAGGVRQSVWGQQEEENCRNKSWLVLPGVAAASCAGDCKTLYAEPLTRWTCLVLIRLVNAASICLTGYLLGSSCRRVARLKVSLPAKASRTISGVSAPAHNLVIRRGDESVQHTVTMFAPWVRMPENACLH